MAISQADFARLLDAKTGLALVEASRGKIGTLVDALLLYCYHYDPVAARYGAVVMNMVRLGGVAIVSGLVVFLLLMWRRDRRRDATAVASQSGEA